MIPINITKPSDVAVIFGIFALIIVTVGFGVQSVVDNQNADINTTFYNNVKIRINGEDGLKGTADDLSTGLEGQEGGSDIPSEESILVSGFNSIRKLGKTFKVMTSSLNDGTTILGIDPVYFITFTSILLISFAVVMYTWIRGK